jgi:hypothetical protein
MEKMENKSMTKRSIFRCLIAALCLVAITGCSEKNGSDTKSESTAIQTTTVSTTDTTTVETTTTTTTKTTSATTETTIEITTTADTDSSEVQTFMLDRIADSLSEPTELTSPFGDISNAYVCFGGTVIYPSVYVLTEDQVKNLSKIMNSMVWDEFSERPTPPTPGPNDLTLYINDHGKCCQLNLMSETYIDENGERYFWSKPPHEDERYSLYEIASDLLMDHVTEIVSAHLVSTHLNMQTEIFKSEEDYSIQKYWDLIWDDVIQFIQDENDN